MAHDFILFHHQLNKEAQDASDHLMGRNASVSTTFGENMYIGLPSEPGKGPFDPAKYCEKATKDWYFETCDTEVSYHLKICAEWD